MALELKRRRFTVAEYHQMAEAGILTEDDRLELIEGEIVEMTPIGYRHARCVTRLTREFSRLFSDVAVVSVQNPVHLDAENEPQPDAVLAHLPDDLYSEGHPTPENIYLVVEVAGSSVEPDRRVKGPLYARSGVFEMWLIDLQQDTVTVYLDPEQSGYRTVRVVRPGESLAPAAFPDRAVAVRDILPD